MSRLCRLLGITLSICLARSVESGDRPVVVFSVKSVDEILGDARHIVGSRPGAPASQVDAVFDRVKTQCSIAGFDTSKPFGSCLSLNGAADFDVTILLPVKNPESLLAFVGIREPQSQGLEGRIFAVQPFGQQAYAKVSGGYCALAQTREQVEKSTGVSSLSRGPHDITLECDLSQYSKTRREQLLEAILAKVEAANARTFELAHQARGASGENPFERGLQFANELRRNQIKRTLLEGERLLCGLSYEASSGSLVIDWNVQAAAGSSLAKEYNAFGKAVPAFGGMFSSDAAMSVSCAMAMPQDLQELFRETFGQGYELAQSEVQKSAVFSSQSERDTARDSLSALADAFQGLKELNFAALITEAAGGKPQITLAVKVSSGKHLSNAFAGWAKFPPSAFEPGEFKINVAQHSGVAIHRLTIPELVGGPFGGTSVHMAVRGDSAFFSLGSDSLACVRSALEKSGSPGPTRPPVSVRAVPSKLIALFGVQSPEARSVLSAFRGSGDVATYEMLPAKDGAKGRLVLGQAFSRALRAAVGGGDGR